MSACEVFAVRLPNWLGDACMSLPTLARLRQAGFRLVCLGKGWAADLLAAEPDTVLRLPGSFWADVAVHRATGARRGLLFPNSMSSALRMRVAGLCAIGYGGWRTPLLAHALAKPHGVHEVLAFWKLADPLCAPADPPPQLGLRLTEEHRLAADAALQEAGIRGDFCVVAPLAVGRIGGRSKQWPGFPLLTRILAERWPVVCCPGPGEEPAARLAAPEARLCPGLGVGAYAAVMARARVVIANDSGPMHLAAAVGARVIGVFGVSDPARTHPWGPQARWLGDARGWPSVDAVAVAAFSTEGPSARSTVCQSRGGRPNAS
ncbi:MAG: glycosyltransferase family 9 protein [Planctomycetota bacterium]|nr:glycosyltransferase family 9 protein [Planctomycetota bacterium]